MADFASITPSFATAPALLLSAATETPVTAADPINTGAQAVDIKREEVTNNKIAIREGFILDRYCLVSRAVRLHLLHFTYETSIFMSLEVAHLLIY
ncbi:conserved domain protein [Parasutterella excrementihominis YIT 11859]|uniref:Conserved domain protein n=1 Tax=Parasutterella excrementihominis YIT 11859 TaxID=762966 RepID=F3QPA1_9BURK|nr:conserved domain protein [Parasutterella excrementihominis YIT 11859]